jgi:hypothetical protein
MESLDLATEAHVGIELDESYGTMNITGPAHLDGTLAISLADGFFALPGSEFDVLTFASRIGDLTIANETGLAGLSFAKSYSATVLTLTAQATGGDANLDGAVDITDLGLLASAWQASGNWLSGDFDASGFIDISDLGILASNWQSGTMPALGLPEAEVPEPIMSALLAIAAWSLKRPGHKHHQRSD